MNDAIKQLLSSKKFLATVTTTLAALVIKIAGKHDIVVDPATANELIQIIVPVSIAYIVGQGIADHGKEKAKIEAAQ